MIDKHKFEQKYNKFGYLSAKFWLKGNDRSPFITPSTALYTIDVDQLKSAGQTAFFFTPE